jgi:hypothetical protein
MRRLKTFPALASVRMPASAQILDVRDRGATQAPALVVSFDEDDEEVVTRSFATIAPRGEAIPPGAQFVASWRALDLPQAPIFCLFELGDDMPTDLPYGYYGPFRLLRAAGFTLRADKAWIAPPDVPAGQLSREQICAVAELQECGYGPVVNA